MTSSEDAVVQNVEERNRRHDLSNTPLGIDIGGRGHFLENLAGEVTQRAVAIEQELYGDALFFLEEGAAHRETLLDRTVIGS